MIFSEYRMKIVASNKIDVGDMTGKFEFFNKSFYKKASGGATQGDMGGNHLIIFDGKKQQIIKLDADIDLKPKKAMQPPRTAPTKGSAPYSKTYSQTGEVRHGPGDLVDPASIIAQNKSIVDRGAGLRAQNQEQTPAVQDEKADIEDLIEREMVRTAINEMDREGRRERNLQESQCTMQQMLN